MHLNAMFGFIYRLRHAVEHVCFVEFVNDVEVDCQIPKWCFVGCALGECASSEVMMVRRPEDENSFAKRELLASPKWKLRSRCSVKQ